MGLGGFGGSFATRKDEVNVLNDKFRAAARARRATRDAMTGRSTFQWILDYKEWVLTQKRDFKFFPFHKPTCDGICYVLKL